MFYGFFCLGITAFGGALPLARHMIVEKRRWLTANEFTELLGLCQFLPGGNIINLSVALGMKFHGPKGAFAALMGLIPAPSVIVVLLSMVYGRYQHDLQVQHLLASLASSAARLLISMAIKIGQSLRRNPAELLVALLYFLVIAVFRFLLLWTMLILTPLSILVVWRQR